MYTGGMGVAQDSQEAVKWWRLAAEQGDVSAQVQLGAMYGTGQGVPQDDGEAVKWFQLAAQQGQAKAQFNLGLMYMSGRGVPQDDVQAYAWFNIAAAQGTQPNAVVFRNEISEEMTPSQREAGQKLSKELWEKYGKK